MKRSGEPTDDSFFGTLAEDEELERANHLFWRALLDHARTEMNGQRVRAVLDIGCHFGGLLDRLCQAFQPREVFGVEPLDGARERARFRLARSGASVTLVPPDRWDAIPDDAVDLATCHEVLHLIADVPRFMARVARVLRPGGCALLVLGSHSENPTWTRWKSIMLDQGIEVHDHAPLDILAHASRAGLATALRPLRRDGWVIYDPTVARYPYDSMAEMLDHQYRHKLLFRLLAPAAPARPAKQEERDGVE